MLFLWNPPFAKCIFSQGSVLISAGNLAKDDVLYILLFNQTNRASPRPDIMFSCVRIIASVGLSTAKTSGGAVLPAFAEEESFASPCGGL